MKKKLIVFLTFLITAVILTGAVTAYLDPFMVYHAPRKAFFYTLDNQRYQNRGILKFYDYDAVIAGTSITQNFSTDQLDDLFGVTSVRVSLSGSTYYEAAEEIDIAVNSGHELKLALISLDLNHLIEDKDTLRTDLGVYPEYLSNSNPFDDVKYLFNRDVMMDYCIPMIAGWLKGDAGGATEMEEYNRMGIGTTGADVVLADRTGFLLPDAEDLEGLTEDEILLTMENLEQNVLRLARENPDTQFIYFFPPYSMAWWGERFEEGILLKYLEAAQLAAEAMLELDNIELYFYLNARDITTDLSNYADYIHYTADVNEILLEKMAAGDVSALVTKDNYQLLFEEQREFLLDFDYNSLFGS